MPTANLGLPFLEAAQAQKHVTHNEALRILDALVQLAVLDRHLSAPPGSPGEGQRWIVAAAPTGAWAGRGNHVAAWQDGAWQFTVPQSGFIAFVVDEATLYFWNGAAWTSMQSIVTTLQNLTLLGVGTTADATNPFSAKLNNALWVAKTAAEGGDGDLRYKLSKETAADTLSLLFQTNFSGRAELGLTGSDDLAVKVSPDGSSWKEALRADRSTGKVTMDGMTVSRDAAVNLLPDSGRFIGNANNQVFSGVTYTAPSYLSAVGGSTLASYAKFIHDNNDYGGIAGALNSAVKDLIDKIRPSETRRFGPEWYVIKLTRGTTAVEPVTIGTDTFDLMFTNSFVPLPTKLTVGYYVRVLSGKAAVLHSVPDKSFIEDAEYVSSSPPTVLLPGVGWQYVNLLTNANAFGYQYSLCGLVATNGAEVLLAMPQIAFGHVRLDKNLGVLPNDKIFG